MAMPTKYNASATARAIHPLRSAPRAVRRAVAAVGQESDVVGDLRSAEAGEHPHRPRDDVNCEPDEEPINPAWCVAEANRLRGYYLCIHVGYL